MADLSTLDPLAPPGSEDRSLGDDRIRETRAAILGSFGIEHALTGEHKFLMGALSGIPTAGHAGRLFVDTTNNQVLIDDGAKWVLFKAGGFKATHSLVNIPFGTTDTDTVSIPNIVVPEGCTVVGLAIATVAPDAAAADVIKGSIKMNSTDLNFKDQHVQYNTGGGYVQLVVFGFKVLAAGTYTGKLVIKGSAHSGATADQILAIMMV